MFLVYIKEIRRLQAIDLSLNEQSPFSSVTLFIPCMGGDIAWDLELEKSSNIEINKQGAIMIPPNPPDTYVVVAENKDNMLGSFGASAICLDIP